MGRPFGYKHSEETKRKMGAARIALRLKCNCDNCGAAISRKKSAIENHKRHFCAPKCYYQHRAEKLPPEEQQRWRGGISGELQIGRTAKRYRRVREAVLERDKYTCTSCGGAKKLEVHHIKKWVAHPDLRYDMNNMKTLCKQCHLKIEGIYTAGHPICQKK
jgi:5-methylcytosine-specific restriction endonuclease McrA